MKGTLLKFQKDAFRFFNGHLFSRGRLKFFNRWEAIVSAGHIRLVCVPETHLPYALKKNAAPIFLSERRDFLGDLLIDKTVVRFKIHRAFL